MPTILITFPYTGRLESTGIETEDRVMPEIEEIIDCPASGKQHAWTSEHAYLSDNPSPERVRRA